jgi:DNA-binding transcriptional LysR family regulator
MGLSALSHRLVREELARGTLKPVKVAGWPLRRQIRIVRLKDAFVLKAVQHFLRLARKRIPEIRFVEGIDAALADSQVEIRK